MRPNNMTVPTETGENEAKQDSHTHYDRGNNMTVSENNIAKQL